MAMCDLVIVHPGAVHGIYGDLGNELVAVEPPLWSRLIAGYVRDRGHSVQIIDAEALRMGAQQVVTQIGAAPPRFVCLAVYGHQPSGSTQQMVGAAAIAAEMKKRVPHIEVIMVGGHVAALPERTLREEAIDYACCGEGPLTIEGLLRGDNPIDIPGLVWRDGNGICINHTSPLIADLDRDLHGNAWDLLPMQKYRAHNWQCFGDLSKRRPYASIYTSLGCPFKCSFCCINAPFQSNRYRMRSPAAVVSELQMLHDRYGVATVKITDEMFVLAERHYTAICEGLIASGLGDKLNIWAYARIDTVKPHTLQMFRDAGIRWLALGIESGSKHVRDGADKALRNDDIIGVVRQIQEAGINVIGNYMVGLRDDTMETMEQTYQLAVECNTEFMNVYSTMAYPGSRLYDQAIARGWALPESWAGYSQHNQWSRPLDTEHVAARTVLAFRDQFFTRYFTNPRYLDMIKQKFGEATAEHVRAMTTYKLRRNLLECASPMST